MRIPALILTLCTWAAAAVSAEEVSSRDLQWHQWRGPHANGVATSVSPPVHWSESQNITWKVEVPGRGSSTPIIWNDRIFLTTAIKTDRVEERSDGPAEQSRETPPSRGSRRGRRSPPPTNFYQYAILCYDRASGEQLWQQVAAEAVPHEGLHPTNTHASGSPTTDGKHLFVSFGSYGIYCYDLDGNRVWGRDLGDMQTRNGFGEGSSPALCNNTLVVPWDHEGPSFLAALDASTGETKWQVNRDEVTTWATPLVVEHQGRTQIITNGTKRVRSYDLATGDLIWECGGQATNPIPCPVTLDGIAYCMTGYRGYAVYALPLNASGDITDTDRIAWRRTDAGPYVSSPVLYQGQLYFTKSREAILSSLDAKTGDTIFGPVRLPKLDSLYASPVAAAGRVYFTGRNGTTVVIRHGTELDVLATNVLDEGVDASLAMVGDEIFVRGERHLYCISAEN